VVSGTRSVRARLPAPASARRPAPWTVRLPGPCARTGTHAA